ncbi:MAG: phosphohistidine phosphatase SixA [Candidatus Scalindua sp.]|jgi:phosphohistidine phosphatase|nr:phosphohistidine phosphatase SixA [Candidatus Scalindua sp.]MBT5307222.1 phosphohistidine phosphatase SixA [Candidatus Scalindua sp.]MBT6050781.1 phosphohistidine phosphatase SixA [Candidatus Scalindua sp.]MBT6231337.1 phosphohistidine phosphatase SixA [Candidatus Scalindua sp.]MBT6562523.1 phosphohistidine phosphatase SixA [Candidatus Scalindua sp.]
MEIYLVRHGEAFTKEEDTERHLNKGGVNQCLLMGKALKRLDITFDLIVSSPKVRARQTAEIIAEEVGYSKKEIKITETLEPTAPPGKTLSYLNKFSGIKSVMLAGHLPLLGYLASELLSNTSHISFYFETGAVCKINIGHPDSHAGDFCWFLAPEHLRLMAQT